MPGLRVNVAIIAETSGGSGLPSSRDKVVPTWRFNVRIIRKWKEAWCSVGLLLAIAACLPAHAVGRLNIDLRQVEPAGRGLMASDGTIDVVLTNTGDQTIEVLKDDIPYQNKRGRLTGSAFKVSDTKNGKADYDGIFADYISDVIRTLRLAPGQKEIRRINIVQNYKVSAGQRYTVSLKPVRYLDRPRSSFTQTSVSGLMRLMKSVETTPIQVLIDPSLDVQSIQARGKFSSTVNPPTMCDGNKPALFETARSLAAQMAYEAAYHVATSYGYTFEPEVA